MSRIDDLLQQAIVTGAIPPEATEAERAELAGLLGGAAALRTGRRDMEAEADATMPIARARFERFLAAQPGAVASRPVTVASRPHPGILARVFRAHRGLALSGAAVAIGLLAVVALFGSQALLSNTDTASAQVLSADDYVQVQGVVRSSTTNGDQRTVALDSPVGLVQVTLASDTSVVDDQNAVDASTIKPGDQLLIGGVALNNHAIAAHTVAVSQPTNAALRRVKLKALTKLLPNLEGKVSLLTISKDGSKARVLIDAPNGNSYIVNIDVAAAEELLRLSSTALGAQVRVNAGANVKTAIFALALTSPAPTSARTATPDAPRSPASAGAKRPDASAAGGKPSFVSVKGVITGRAGPLFQIETRDGVLTIQVRAETRRLVGNSGLTRADIGNPDSVIGHLVTVTGGLDPKTGRVIADLVVVGPKAP